MRGWELKIEMVGFETEVRKGKTKRKELMRTDVDMCL